jgi:hypothetical protein
VNNKKYEPLTNYLKGKRYHGMSTIHMGLKELDAIINGLPRTARINDQWWANDDTHVQAQAWMEAGFRIQTPSAWRSGEIVFVTPKGE